MNDGRLLLGLRTIVEGGRRALPTESRQCQSLHSCTFGVQSGTGKRAGCHCHPHPLLPGLFRCCGEAAGGDWIGMVGFLGDGKEMVHVVRQENSKIHDRHANTPFQTTECRLFPFDRIRS